MKNEMNPHSWKDAFHMTRTERRGTLALSIVLSVLALWPVLKPAPGAPPPLPKDLLPEIELVADTAPPEILLFPFNPNTLTLDSFLLLGVPERNARILINYREKGGTFRNADDIRSVYGWRDADHDRLAEWMKFPVVPNHTPDLRDRRAQPGSKPAHPKPASIDINAADETQWQQIRGIGPYYAQRILRFREALGGFHNIEQVSQTYRLPDSVFQAIRPFLTIDRPVTKIDINTVTAEELAKHPYINKREAYALVAYRQQHGPFGATSELDLVRALGDSTGAKMKPYLYFGSGIAQEVDTALVDKNDGVDE